MRVAQRGSGPGTPGATGVSVDTRVCELLWLSAAVRRTQPSTTPRPGSWPTPPTAPTAATTRWARWDEDGNRTCYGPSCDPVNLNPGPKENFYVHPDDSLATAPDKNGTPAEVR